MHTIDPPREVFRRFPSQEAHKNFIQNCRTTIQNVLDGTDKRFLVIVGPCSIHDIQGTLEFASLLKNLQLMCPSLFFVMRTYFEKARSSYNWKGLINDPYLNGSCQISYGIQLVRKLLIQLADLEIPTACEFLDPLLQPYISDLISWGCIGARTTASQVHRQMASALNIPMGFKNTPDGNIETAVQGIFSATKPHTFLATNDENKICVQETTGNPYAHLVLRGGENGPNYHKEAITESSFLLRQNHLSDRLLIDCAHDNTQKNYHLQPDVFSSVLGQYLDGNQTIKGAMLESYLFSGNQQLKKDLDYGISITDPCLSWEATASLLFSAQQQIEHKVEEKCHLSH